MQKDHDNQMYALNKLTELLKKMLTNEACEDPHSDQALWKTEFECPICFEVCGKILKKINATLYEYRKCALPPAFGNVWMAMLFVRVVVASSSLRVVRHAAGPSMEEILLLRKWPSPFMENILSRKLSIVVF